MTRIYTEASREYSKNYYKNNKYYFQTYWREKNLLKKLGEDLDAIREKKKLEKLDKKLLNKNVNKFKRIDGRIYVYFD